MAIITGLLIGERFLMTIDLVEELTKQLTVYFEFIGVMNDKTYSFTMDCKECLLVKLASYTLLVLENKLFLSPGIKFSEIRLWADLAVGPNEQGNKLPEFKAPLRW